MEFVNGNNSQLSSLIPVQTNTDYQAEYTVENGYHTLTMGDTTVDLTSTVQTGKLRIYLRNGQILNIKIHEL